MGVFRLNIAAIKKTRKLKRYGLKSLTNFPLLEFSVNRLHDATLPHLR